MHIVVIAENGKFFSYDQNIDAPQMMCNDYIENS